PPEISTPSLHDALPIWEGRALQRQPVHEDRTRVIGQEEPVDLLGGMRRPPAHDADLASRRRRHIPDSRDGARESRDRNLLPGLRSEEHTSELQSPYDLV